MVDKRYMHIIERDFSQKIDIDSILYIAQDLRDVKIVTDKEVIKKHGKVIDMTGQVSDDFYLAHSYVMINLSNIEKMMDETVYFKGGHSLKLGKKLIRRRPPRL